MVLFMVALLGVSLAAVGEAWQSAVRREREVELLFIGNEFRQAIGRYYEATPGRRSCTREASRIWCRILVTWPRAAIFGGSIWTR
jgi:hypothetical protein